MNQDLFNFEMDDDDNHTFERSSAWALMLVHFLHILFVFYSGAHNVMASISAAGDNSWAQISQFVGVLIVEATILGVYFAGMGGRFTGAFQKIVAIFTWGIAILFASMGIIADSRVHAGQELGATFDWYLSTGLYVAPVVLIVLLAIVAATDPKLQAFITGSRERDRLKVESMKAKLRQEFEVKKANILVLQMRTEQKLIAARAQYDAGKSLESQAAIKSKSRELYREDMSKSGIMPALAIGGGESQPVVELGAVTEPTPATIEPQPKPVEPENFTTPTQAG